MPKGYSEMTLSEGQTMQWPKGQETLYKTLHRKL